MKDFIVYLMLLSFAVYATGNGTERIEENKYTAALIEMAANYEAARNQKVCEAERVVVALSQCKKRGA